MTDKAIEQDIQGVVARVVRQYGTCRSCEKKASDVAEGFGLIIIPGEDDEVGVEEDCWGLLVTAAPAGLGWTLMAACRRGSSGCGCATTTNRGPYPTATSCSCVAHSPSCTRRGRYRARRVTAKLRCAARGSRGDHAGQRRADE